MNIIGNKHEFAVEYRIADNKKMLGYGKLWIQNSFYGTSKDLIHLNGYLIPLIENILEASTLKIDLNNFEKEKLFEKLKNESTKTSKYLIRSSTFTDDFNGYKFKSGEEIILIWQINKDSEVVFEDLKNYSESVILKKMNYMTGKIILDELKEKIKKARA